MVSLRESNHLEEQHTKAWWLRDSILHLFTLQSGRVGGERMVCVWQTPSLEEPPGTHEGYPCDPGALQFLTCALRMPSFQAAFAI